MSDFIKTQWPEHWTNGGTGVTKLTRIEQEVTELAIVSYGSKQVWLQDGALHSSMRDLSDFWEIYDRIKPLRSLATELTRLRAELEAERRRVEGLRKELHDVRSVCTEALSRLEETEEVYKPREDANYWRWEGTGEGLAGIEWDVTTPLTAEALAALTASERGEL